MPRNGGLPSFPFYPRDWLAGTRHMSLEQKGAYTDLLSYQWENGSIPDDEKSLRLIVGANPMQWKRIWPTVSKHFKPATDALHALRNERLHELFLDAVNYRSEQRAKINNYWKSKKASNTDVFVRNEPKNIPEAYSALALADPDPDRRVIEHPGDVREIPCTPEDTRSSNPSGGSPEPEKTKSLTETLANRMTLRPNGHPQPPPADASPEPRKANGHGKRCTCAECSADLERELAKFDDDTRNT